MIERHASTEDPEGDEDYDKPGCYEIRVKGHLDDRRTSWFEGLTLT